MFLERVCRLHSSQQRLFRPEQRPRNARPWRCRRFVEGLGRVEARAAVVWHTTDRSSGKCRVRSSVRSLVVRQQSVLAESTAMRISRAVSLSAADRQTTCYQDGHAKSVEGPAGQQWLDIEQVCRRVVLS